MNEGDHLIWSNYHLDLDDWREYLLVDNRKQANRNCIR